MSSFEKNCRWHFAQSLGSHEQGPKDAVGETFKKEKYESLVRESIQNSLDVASDEGNPVIVSFMFKKGQSDMFPQLFEIRNHIDSCITTFKDDEAQKKFEPMLDYLDKASWTTFDYLEVKDENTKGMSYKKGDRKCGFYSFVKSVGNSSKSSNSAGGSYGFGKAAFFLISKFNTVLVSTLTEEGKYYFEGVGSLCSHEMDHKNYVPVGFYCNNDEEEPVSKPEDIPDIFRRTTVGASVFVMGLDLEDGTRREAMRSISSAAIKHFWMAILNKKLIVRVGVDNIYNEINSDNLPQFAERMFPEFDDNKRGHKNPRPYIDAVVNAQADDSHLKFENEIPHLGKVCYYLLKSKNGNDYILNMRSPMMLVEHNLNQSQYGFYSVFICTDEKGNEVLRMAENAQHNEWDPRNAHDQDKQKVKEALEAKKDYIQQCIRSVFVSEGAEILEFGGLDDFLTIPSSIDEDDYNPEFGKPTGDLTDDETSSENTELEDVNVRKPKAQNLGDVRVKKKRKKRQKTKDDGEDQPTGIVPEEDDDDDEPVMEIEEPEVEEPEVEDEPEDNPESTEDQGEDTNDEPDVPKEEEIHGEKSTRVKPLRISYRSFAQTSDDGSIVHRLIVHSNRASDRVIIGLISGGESSDEKLAIRKTDNGKIAGNQLTNVTIEEGKTIINVWFADDMRHAIKLKVDEDQ